jgi:hypothetical protein
MLRLKGKERSMNKIRVFKMFEMLNYQGPNLRWMNKEKCIKSYAKFLPK